MITDKSFSDFKKNFYSRIGDGSMFDCMDFNLLKVVLDGLKVDYLAKGKFRCITFSSLWIYQLILLLKQIKFRIKQFLFPKTNPYFNLIKLAQYNNKPYLIIDSSARFVVSEKDITHSLYFHNIIQFLEKKKTIYFVELLTHPHLDFDFYRQGFDEYFCIQPLNGKDKELRKNLLKTFSRLRTLKIFSPDEMENIRMAIELFYNNYRTWKGILKYLHPTVAYFDNHYHREGCLLALKENKIKTIELQHGLIAPEDIFYMFPPIIKSIKDKALFPDKILVYGEFWRKRLLQGAEFSETQINIVGYYHYSNNTINQHIEKELKKNNEDKKIILVTTQTYAHEYFIDFTQWLANDLLQKNYNYIIVVKPHPNENIELYQSLKLFSNVKVVNYNLEDLFSFTDIHVSIFSTTLYDAMRFNIPNYALFVEQFGDYVNSVIESGIAQKLEWKQNPLDLYKKDKIIQKIDAKYYYANFNPSVLLTD